MIPTGPDQHDIIAVNGGAEHTAGMRRSNAGVPAKRLDLDVHIETALLSHAQ